jgi:uncharacterized membrane protein HdeD (DUF308 family)
MDIETIEPVLGRASPWLVGWTGVAFVCGILVIVLPTFSFAIAIIVGLSVLFGGFAHLFFGFHTRNIGGFLTHMLLFGLYELAAICLLVNPLLSIFSLALMLAIFLILEGIAEIVLYAGLRRLRHSVWLLTDGAGTLILGTLMIAQWPAASPGTIAVLIGLSLILSATSRAIFLFAARKLSPAHAR